MAEAADEFLWAAFVRNVRVNVLAEVFSQGIRIGGFIFLARTLQPADFGILRILITSTLLVGMVANAGIPDAIIQRKELDSDHESTAWWLNLVLSAGAATLLCAIAGLIASAMAMPMLTTSLTLLAIPVLIDATSSIANARLRRQLRFSALATADFSAELAFLCGALLMIWLGLPRWSLVAALGARLTFHGLVVWCCEPFLPRRLPRLSAARELFRFSVSVWGGRVLGVVSGNADYLLVGRLLGSQTLGYYVIAWDLLRFVPDRLYYVAGRVTLPTFCRLQHDNRALARAYREFTGYLAKLILPMMTCTAIAAPYVLAGLYGNQWIRAAAPLRILAVGLSLAGLRLAIGSIYYTKDHPSFDIYLHGARLVLVVLAVTSTVRFGLIGVCIAMSAVEALVSIGGQLLAGRLIEMSLLDWLRACGGGMKLALVCGLGAIAGVLLVGVLQVQGLMALALIVLICLLTFVWFGMNTARDLIQGAITPEAVN
ncbi:MAG: lipopolysaccharide biosynthesis protein [Candidatus Binatus sp.]|uniref:lipopolysaccharide biosynthesis protein n=1 Tax=Candidatus Binatus sp. TaxID=2811406 RepID=UPI00271B5A3B|nr:lipopolysaccharide biosynthesis protein [Candidatus Binatus sp.]MDO8432688.1 lipopolysaccharide biosynthesis protein [Candidatus Binatus sp.]